MPSTRLALHRASWVVPYIAASVGGLGYYCKVWTRDANSALIRPSRFSRPALPYCCHPPQPSSLYGVGILDFSRKWRILLPCLRASLF